MNRKETPDILGDIINPDGDRAEIIAGLQWDYSQAEDPEAVRRLAVEYTRWGRKTTVAMLGMGKTLTAIKEALPHDQWLSWLETDGHLDPRTAQRMMQASKYDKMSHLPITVAYLVTGKSIPEEAREQAIEEGHNGRVTVKRAQEIIDQHRPGAFGGGPDAGHRKALCKKCGAELTDPASIARGLGPCCARKPAVLTYERDEDSQEAIYTTPEGIADYIAGNPPFDASGDDRIDRLNWCVARLESAIMAINDGAEITGKHTEALAPIRELRRFMDILRHEAEQIAEGHAIVSQWEGWE